MISSIQVLILQLTSSGSLSISVFMSFRMANWRCLADLYSHKWNLNAHRRSLPQQVIGIIYAYPLSRLCQDSDHLARGNLRITDFLTSLSFNCSSFY